MEIVIRAARGPEISLLAAVERDGDRRYRGYAGVPAGFDDVAPESQLEAARTEGRLWVAARPDEAPVADDVTDGIVGFALVDPVDGQAHLEQLSVRSAFQGHGIGRRLIEAVCAWGRDQGVSGVTLCTFTDVSWNRPLYEHLGFAVVAEDRWTPALRAVFESDAALGLDLSRRVVMYRSLGPGGR
jgi:GNAT superfamily N-acetyltransferase